MNPLNIRNTEPSYMSIATLECYNDMEICRYVDVHSSRDTVVGIALCCYLLQVNDTMKMFTYHLMGNIPVK